MNCARLVAMVETGEVVTLLLEPPLCFQVCGVTVRSRNPETMITGLLQPAKFLAWSTCREQTIIDIYIYIHP